MRKCNVNRGGNRNLSWSWTIDYSVEATRMEYRKQVIGVKLAA
jgi:hypothetical protein